MALHVDYVGDVLGFFSPFSCNNNTLASKLLCFWSKTGSFNIYLSPIPRCLRKISCLVEYPMSFVLCEGQNIDGANESRRFNVRLNFRSRLSTWVKLDSCAYASQKSSSATFMQGYIRLDMSIKPPWSRPEKRAIQSLSYPVHPQAIATTSCPPQNSDSFPTSASAFSQRQSSQSPS